jgi:hypothetical protein
VKFTTADLSKYPWITLPWFLVRKEHKVVAEGELRIFVSVAKWRAKHHM